MQVPDKVGLAMFDCSRRRADASVQPPHSLTNRAREGLDQNANESRLCPQLVHMAPPAGRRRLSTRRSAARRLRGISRGEPIAAIVVTVVFAIGVFMQTGFQQRMRRGRPERRGRPRHLHNRHQSIRLVAPPPGVTWRAAPSLRDATPRPLAYPATPTPTVHLRSDPFPVSASPGGPVGGHERDARRRRPRICPVADMKTAR